MYTTSNKTHYTTLTVRILAGLSSLISFACFIYGQQAHETGLIDTADLGSPFVSPVLYCVEFAFVWSLVVIPIQLSSPYPLHPGIYVTFDLLAWVTVIPIIIVFFLLMEPYFSDGGYSCRSPDVWPCDGKSAAITEQVGSAFALFSAVLHFGLFVWACRATDKLRKSVRSDERTSAKTSSVDA
ncbi:hypothetical protein PHISCL_03519 [Aspergillus sclerotialis]|uniref:MARVEL domain-containing protein n=1 Tax=Aspergillus sclerotialis TaxID=2070753 RepID=A0A3A3A1Y8_9EURO|nr:hypothetical protein PHISCL_03519 [Aspergillus sclerotialis]